MKLAEVVGTHRAIGATRSRKAKAEALAELLRAGRAQREILVPWLSGELPQGRIGIGWAAVRATMAVPPAAGSSLTVGDVHEALSAYAEIRGKGSKARRAAHLAELLGKATEAEQHFLRGLLSGELRQGSLAGVMVEGVAAAAQVDARSVRRATMLSGDLVAASLAAFDGVEALAAFRLEPMRPVQPMLAQTAADPEEALEKLGEALFDVKLDGARVQVHRVGDDVRVVSRQLRDVTHAVPELVEAVRALPVRQIVLDGEVLAWRADGRPHSFQTTMRRFGRSLDVEAMRRELPLRASFFDVLMVDDEPQIDRPLRQRRALLERLLPAEQVVPALLAPSAAEATAFLRRALEQGHEGIMAKAPDSPYEAGARGASWLKLKPAFTLDLLVLAAEWGSGRRRGLLSNLHLGCRGPGGPVMLGKTFKGLTDDTLRWQTQQLLAREVRREGHVVVVRPELVVEVAFNEVQESPRYPEGMALRFARVKRYRTDKSPDQADDLALVRQIHEGRAPLSLRLR